MKAAMSSFDGGEGALSNVVSSFLKFSEDFSLTHSSFPPAGASLGADAGGFSAAAAAGLPGCALRNSSFCSKEGRREFDSHDV
jgi:hypothetical protein